MERLPVDSLKKAQINSPLTGMQGNPINWGLSHPMTDNPFLVVYKSDNISGVNLSVLKNLIQ